MEKSADAETDRETLREIREKCVKDLVAMIALETVKEGLSPTGPYDIIGLIHEKYRVLLSPGALYPLLTSLQKRGLIEGKQTKRKKVYTITDKGKAALQLMATTYQDILKNLK